MGKKVYRRTALLSFGFASFLFGLVLARRVNLGAGVLPLVVCFTPLLWRRTKLSMLSICCIGLLLGCWRGSVFMRALLPYHLLARQPVTIRAQVLSDGVYAERSQLRFDVGNIMLLEPDSQKLIGSIDVSGFGARQVQRGDIVEVRGKLYPTRGSRQARMSFAQIQRVEKGGSALDAIRRRFAAGLQSALPEPTASLALGILIGQRTTLPESLNKDLSITGLTHIVAVSGYNLTVIVQLVRRLLEKRSKYQATMATLTLMFGFILLTGMSASVVRAGVVSGLSLWAWYYGRTFKPLLLLLLSACLTAGWFPPYVWSDLGWHLSFLAFSGILLFAPLLVRAYGWQQVHPVVGLVLETIAAQLMTLPVILYTFGRLSVIALLANMLIVPLVPLAMLLSLIAGLGAMLAPVLVGWWAWPARLLLTYMTDLTTLAARLPLASLQVQLSAWQMVLCYLCVVLVMMMWWRKGQQNGKITDRKIAGPDDS